MRPILGKGGAMTPIPNAPIFCAWAAMRHELFTQVLPTCTITLKFFGEIDTNGLEVLEQKIANVVSEFKPFDIKIKSCGAFPNNNHIKVIWVGIDDDSIIRELHDKLDKEFTRLGFDKDKKFSTHLTIGRMKAAKNKNQVKSTIEEFSDVDIGEMRVNNISLKKSTLKPSGPVYEDLKVFEL